MTLPMECHGCGEVAAGLEEHADGCEVAVRIAEREAEQLDDVVGTPWELEGTQERIRELRQFVEDHGGSA